MDRYVLVAIVVGLLGLAPRYGQAITLASDGKTSYVIVTPAKPVVTELTAAKELQEHLNAITGADFPIVSESNIGNGKKMILVGQSLLTNKLLPKADWKSLGSDGTLIVTKGDTLILAGGRPRGVMYAVFTFLEDVLGCRWWTGTETHIPSTPKLSIKNLNMKYVPNILCREAFLSEAINYPVFAARNRLTGHFNRIPDEYGGHYSILGFCHTFYQLIPPDKYFAQHPEWFGLINGERKTDGAQLCLTNEEMRKELVKNCLELIKTNPSAGIISVAQNDWAGNCECTRCKAVEETEASPAGLVIQFVNKVAQDIEKQYPDFLVETLAYHYTRKPPKNIKPRKNVLIRLCSDESDYGLTVNDPDPKSKAFKKNLADWAAISNHLFVWTYIANFHNFLYPNPTLPVYETNIRMFEKNKVVGAFIQGDAYNKSACFVRLRTWVLAHLLWNPALDQNKLVQEFTDGYYGKAGPYMRKYLKLVEEAYSKKTSGNWMTCHYIIEGRKLFAQAQKAVAENPALLEKVERERIPLDYLLLMNFDEVEAFASENNTDYFGSKDLVTAIAEFDTAVKKHGVGYFSEDGSLEPRLKIWNLHFSQPPKMPVELGDLSGKRIIDLQELRVKLYSEGIWVNVAEDLDASNKVACVLAPEEKNWAIQYMLDGLVTGKYHCYAQAKVDAIAESGDAFMLGIYDIENKIFVLDKTASIEEMAGGRYKLIDLGTHELDSGCQFWFSAADNPSGVRSISVDRVLLIAE